MPDWTISDNQHPGLPAMLGDVGVGRVLGGRYRLVALIGSGSSARVYLADDVSLGRRVAVKALRAGLTGDYRFLRRFRAEAKAAAQLGHPNILAVYDWGEDAAAAYLVTEVLLGGSLRNMIDASPQLSPSQGLLVALQVAQALSYAHELGWVHRDIKPANLMFGKDGRLRIADFGIARALAEATWTEPEGVLVGTARYAAPEQATARSVDGKADVYSLALTVVEAVTGRVPLLGETALATMMLRQDRDLAGLEDLGALGEVLMEAGRSDPAARPTGTELIDRLLRAARNLPRPGRLPLVEFRLPTAPAGVALIDLRAARVDPPLGSSGTASRGGPARPFAGAALGDDRGGAADDTVAPGAGGFGADPTGSGPIPLPGGGIQARPRPVPARLADRASARTPRTAPATGSAGVAGAAEARGVGTPPSTDSVPGAGTRPGADGSAVAPLPAGGGGDPGAASWSLPDAERARRERVAGPPTEPTLQIRPTLGPAPVKAVEALPVAGEPRRSVLGPAESAPAPADGDHERDTPPVTRGRRRLRRRRTD
ncbi:MAG: protein kinase [Acidimicrobiia bacterium]|nr:protein kinase [Acidimicrobiia bacterium]